MRGRLAIGVNLRGLTTRARDASHPATHAKSPDGYMCVFDPTTESERNAEKLRVALELHLPWPRQTSARVPAPSLISPTCTFGQLD